MEYISFAFSFYEMDIASGKLVYYWGDFTD